MTSFAKLILIITLAFPTMALADYGGGSSYGGNSLSNATTNKIARNLTRGVSGCFKLDKVYRYDCYREVYGQAAAQLKGNKAYDGARQALETVEQSLGRTIQRNLDPTAPQARRGFQQFRAIKPAALPTAKRDFIAALETAETQLLRSPPNTQPHFQTIAAAINTNKVLLRSAQLLLQMPELVRQAMLGRAAVL